MQLGGVNKGVTIKDIVAHSSADSDDGVGIGICISLDPRRNSISAAELFLFPRSPRFQGVCGDYMGDVVQQSAEVSAHVRVPRVRVNNIGLFGCCRHLQINA
jgi:hypothetical protein